MLVLSRKINERIIIINKDTDERIELQVVHVLRNKCQLGITAPQNYVIVREEIEVDNSLER